MTQPSMPRPDETVRGRTQAQGAFTIALNPTWAHHQIQVKSQGTPANGVITVAVRAPGMSDFDDLAPTVDLVNGPFIKVFDGRFSAVRITPTGFDGTTFDVTISNW